MQGEGGQDLALTLWSPERCLRSVSPEVARYSRGFLRCRPEKWFPGFAMQWLPLAHSLGIEIKLCEAKPVAQAPRGWTFAFAGTVDGEPLGLALEDESAEVLLEAVLPSAAPRSRQIVLEYLARRFLSSMAISWSGPESSLVQFEPDLDAHQIREVGAIKVVVSINGEQSTVWILLGQVLVDRLDGLWRRQLQSTSRHNSEDTRVQVEFAHLTVPPSLLADYLKPGTTVDLETPVSDVVMVVCDGRPFLPAKLCRLGDCFGVETIAAPLPVFQLPAGTTRLSIELGQADWNGVFAREMSQPGAVYDTGIRLGDRVGMVVNGEQVAEALLRTYQGHFVVSVI